MSKDILFSGALSAQNQHTSLIESFAVSNVRNVMHLNFGHFYRITFRDEIRIYWETEIERMLDDQKEL